MVLDISGVYPPIPTPFHANGDIDYNSLRANLAMWNQHDLRGYVVMGSNGEVVYLSQDEKVQVVKTVRETIPAEKLIIVGAGCEGTRQTIRLCERMAKAGADAVLLINPHYYTGLMKSPAVMKNYYTEVANASPVPCILYNMPGNTGIDIPIDVCVQLSHHPNIIGMKESGGKVHRIAQIKHENPDFQVLAGSASFLLPALEVGATGGVCALANIAPKECLELLKLFYGQQHIKAKKLQGSLVAPNTAVTSKYGVAGLKAAMEFVGMKGGPVRSPMLDLDSKNRNIVKSILQRANLLPSSRL